jgi:hypothetical protein
MMKNKQELIHEKQYAYDTQKQSLLLSSLLENEFILKLGGRKKLDEWRDMALDTMIRLKKEIQDLQNN